MYIREYRTSGSAAYKIQTTTTRLGRSFFSWRRTLAPPEGRPASTVLDRGARELARSRQARHNAMLLQLEARELVQTFRERRFRPIVAPSGVGGQDEVRQKLGAFA